MGLFFFFFLKEEERRRRRRRRGRRNKVCDQHFVIAVSIFHCCITNHSQTTSCYCAEFCLLGFWQGSAGDSPVTRMLLMQLPSAATSKTAPNPPRLSPDCLSWFSPRFLIVWPQVHKKKFSKRLGPDPQALVQPPSAYHLLMPVGQSEACGKAQSQRIDSHMQKQEFLEFLKMVSIILCMCAYSRTKTSWKFLVCSFFSYQQTFSSHTPHSMPKTR